MRVSIVGTVGIPANYGGFETLVEYLVSKKKEDGIHYTVYCSKKAYSDYYSEYKGAILNYIPLKANGIQSIPYDIWAMIKSLRRSDVILILGVSGCVFLPLVRLFSKVRIVTNIDGLEHRRDKWNTYIRRFLKFSERMAIRYSDVIIADNEGIASYVRAEYNISPVVIAYGGNHVCRADLTTKIRNTYGIPNKYAFKVCRIEPENNIGLILEAFSKDAVIPLVLVGNWCSSSYGVRLKEKYFNTQSLILLDAIYDKNILNQLRSNCAVYIHGHSAGGTNPSLVEAMSLKLPILCFDVIYNRETTQNSAFYFRNKNELISILNKISGAELLNLREKMYQIAQKQYTWERIVESYEGVYNK